MIAASVVLLMTDGIPNDCSLCLFVSSFWRANRYVVCISSLILGGTSPCAMMLKKMARVVGLTERISDLRLDLLYDAIRLMNISSDSESSFFPGGFACFNFELMSVIYCEDICIFFAC